MFRITQTDDKIIKEEIFGQETANQTHFEIGRKVRNTIKEIGGTMPENLKSERHIKEIKKLHKKILKSDFKKE